MITRLSAFVFGSPPNDDGSPNITAKSEVEAVSNALTESNLISNAHDQMHFTDVPTNFFFDGENRNREEWVFIDVLNKNVEPQENNEIYKTKIEDVVPGLASRSSQSPPATPNSADSDAGGWLVTPPACFVTRRPLPPIAASPLDNLLIEHPSMSVYVSPEAAVNICRNAIIDAISAVNSEYDENDAMDYYDSVNGHENSPPARPENRQAASTSSRAARSARGNGVRSPGSQITRSPAHDGNAPPWLLSRQAIKRMSRVANNNNKGKRPPLFQPKPCGSSR